MERDDSRHCNACDGHGGDEPVPYDCDHLATIATLRAALDGLVELGERLLRYSGNSLMTDAEQEDWIALRAALATAKEAGNG
jgi:hypothetical protein